MCSTSVIARHYIRQFKAYGFKNVLEHFKAEGASDKCRPNLAANSPLTHGQNLQKKQLLAL